MRDDLALSGVEPRYQIVRLGPKTTRTGTEWYSMVWCGISDGQNGTVVWYRVVWNFGREGRHTRGSEFFVPAPLSAFTCKHFILTTYC